jgi:hypothetical protein
VPVLPPRARPQRLRQPVYSCHPTVCTRKQARWRSGAAGNKANLAPPGTAEASQAAGVTRRDVCGTRGCRCRRRKRDGRARRRRGWRGWGLGWGHGPGSHYQVGNAAGEDLQGSYGPHGKATSVATAALRAGALEQPGIVGWGSARPRRAHGGPYALRECASVACTPGWCGAWGGVAPSQPRAVPHTEGRAGEGEGKGDGAAAAEAKRCRGASGARPGCPSQNGASLQALTWPPHARQPRQAPPGFCQRPPARASNTGPACMRQRGEGEVKWMGGMRGPMAPKEGKEGAQCVMQCVPGRDAPMGAGRSE